uniref:Photosystem I reaction center subunit XII n=5 Tax=Cupressaceae TaxID=3367 RepID=A0A1C8QIR6_9CONI|nr:photosystem I protein M [Glyptostrobus pensilis]YP_009379823.1 photosystem I subunit XII [Taxodium distichum]YP_009714171.1 photosystem I subunit XII [Taxodium mucronatum]QGJ04588.1 photosystem I subunit XII [Taxodium distichum var. imbricarium]QQV68924.1 photosystem I subunit XII [Taxodium sp. 'Zhongshanshan']ANT70601.1 photosystem I protein M [Glyptostrobus pensilis]QGJ04505.1 photosystem I subunit XII [Taxodium mucronatum]QGJ04671.1 photosystem I subunit XII [Taxodium distichum]
MISLGQILIALLAAFIVLFLAFRLARALYAS